MDLSKIKVEVYDLLALLVPGLLLICEVWITVRGWHMFAASIVTITAPTLSVLLLIAFLAGHAVQEVGDLLIKRMRGPRFFKSARDEYWKTAPAATIKERLETETQATVDVDTAFDMCLTKVKGQFEKRDLFLATSDLARSGVVLSALSVIPTSYVIWRSAMSHWGKVSLNVFATVIIGMLVALFWKRMVRFREMSEQPVFNTYLAQMFKPLSKAESV